ncbi:MAG: alpha-mannosidase, partial [Alicyclobacillus sp.]|nr:alpha-mannosidase [Alicyclobacillus sp.]
MSALDARIERLRARVAGSYWGDRIAGQLAYACELSKQNQGRHDALLSDVLSELEAALQEDGAVTAGRVRSAEQRLGVLSGEAKQFEMICAAHAHIDMNWMWRWDETVAVTLDTFRTMLNLMEEYPGFVFSQSQAATYHIVERYAPEMLDEIRRRVHEGRWEVTAATWVECDKNLPSGESLARQILYTKRYLSALLGIPAASLDLEFEPDTFGHSAHLPDILASGGIRHYYHCRGEEQHTAYRWVSPSGASVVVYREPLWYNGQIDAEMARHVPSFCARHGVNAMLKVYGVGDHGGGPTRRDLERLLDMMTWPVFPRVRFGTFREFFALLDERADSLPVLEGERNFIFTGCYSSQTRIKKANRVAEETLRDAELFETFAALQTGARYPREDFELAWRNVLFNQFHDIIPGSGVIDTREYAMGRFQETMAIANTRRSMALRRIAARIAAGEAAGAQLAERVPESTSEGAGVGYGVDAFQVFQTERGRGRTRVFHVFNATLADREEAVELVIWDWNYNLRRMRFTDAQGRVLEHQLLDSAQTGYWGHQYVRVLVRAAVPAGGYNTIVLTEEDGSPAPLPFPDDPRVERPHGYVLENRSLRAIFDSRDGSLVSLVDKASGEELIAPGKSGQ